MAATIFRIHLFPILHESKHRPAHRGKIDLAFIITSWKSRTHLSMDHSASACPSCPVSLTVSPTSLSYENLTKNSWRWSHWPKAPKVDPDNLHLCSRLPTKLPIEWRWTISSDNYRNVVNYHKSRCERKRLDLGMDGDDLAVLASFSQRRSISGSPSSRGSPAPVIRFNLFECQGNKEVEDHSIISPILQIKDSILFSGMQKDHLM